MFFIYDIALIILALVLSPFIGMAFLVKEKFRAGFLEKMGFYHQISDKKHTVLVHAVSVGEVNAVENFVKKLRKDYPDYNIILTTTTKTGQEVARAKLAKFTDKILYFPYDFSFSVKAFLSAVKPNVIIIAETEIWPNFSRIVKRREIPLYIINGRISPKSYNGYKKISFFIKKVLSCYTKILMQSPADAQRILDIGADSVQVEVMGNLKFDIDKTLSAEEVRKLKSELKLTGNRLFVAASTHKGEDEIALEIFKKAKEQVPKLKMLIAPRHPQRFVQVYQLIKSYGFKCSKRSKGATFKDNDVIMLDTMGELAKLFSLAHIAFIGGSFSGTGGHNPLEANIWGVPVISGPVVFNFKDIYRSLTQTKAATLASDQNETEAVLLKFLTDEDYYKEAVADTKKIFKTNAGAVNKALNSIFPKKTVKSSTKAKVLTESAKS